MAKHKDIQDPAKYTEKDYDIFEMKLFSQFTSVEQLEEICMTLAHLPTKRAQELLKTFSQSERAKEVGWLECALDEGQYLYLSPMNKQEERDFLALKMLQELEDKIVDLQVKYDELDLAARKQQIEQEAITALIKRGELDQGEVAKFYEVNLKGESEMKELEKQIARQEKIFQQIKASIKTERYKNVPTSYMQHIHF
ncbi:hypothetical protein U27_00267 [Candidatus Vecturithrix granuli]|uniref:Uncharacterized protein n=1 Tax=Vecturithrix granuli TaxID=1499967 RepID=A0A081C721_VECG1|nr:hypothetical protein U27_00267 [Candidatus Vecturithrix granuli]